MAQPTGMAFRHTGWVKYLTASTIPAVLLSGKMPGQIDTHSNRPRRHVVRVPDAVTECEGIGNIEEAADRMGFAVAQTQLWMMDWRIIHPRVTAAAGR